MNNWNLEYPKLERTLINVCLYILRVFIIITLLIVNIIVIKEINIFALIIIDILAFILWLFIIKFKKLTIVRIKIINSIIYKIDKNSQKIIGNINEITSYKKNLIGISVYKGNKVLFSFNIINNNDSREFYKYLTNNIEIEHNSSNFIIKSHKRYNYFLKIFLIFNCLFFLILIGLGLIFKIKYYNLRLTIITIIFLVIFLYALFESIYYIFYTLFVLKFCYFKFENDSVSFSILKVSNKKKRFNPTYSASGPYSRHSKGYRGILVKEDVILKYEDIKPKTEIIGTHFGKKLNFYYKMLIFQCFFIDFIVYL